MKEIENVDYVVCRICGDHSKEINRHVLSKHPEISMYEYREKYPDARTVCENTIKKNRRWLKEGGSDKWKKLNKLISERSKLEQDAEIKSGVINVLEQQIESLNKELSKLHKKIKTKKKPIKELTKEIFCKYHRGL